MSSLDNKNLVPVDADAEPYPEPIGCKHNTNNAIDCNIRCLDGLHRYVLEIQVWCEDCGRRFQFEKLSTEISYTQPCVIQNGHIAILPIVPGEIQHE